MKRLISGAVVAAAFAATSTAYAADMAYKAPPAPPPYSWTGFYVGFNAGWTWADSKNVTFTGTDTGVFGPGGALAAGLIPSSHNVNNDGFIGGFQAGYNWQTGNVVWGLEADIQYSGARQSYAFGNVLGGGFVPFTLSGNNDLDWFGTARGRVGWLVTPMTLVYATGGVFYGHRSLDMAFVGPTWAPPAFLTGSSSSTKASWTIGGGIEYALGGGWSAKGEYLYYDGDNRNVTVGYVYGANRSTLTSSVEDGGHIVRFGVNYKWGGYGKAPVVAKY